MTPEEKAQLVAGDTVYITRTILSENSVAAYRVAATVLLLKPDGIGLSYTDPGSKERIATIFPVSAVGLLP